MPHLLFAHYFSLLPLVIGISCWTPYFTQTLFILDDALSNPAIYGSPWNFTRSVYARSCCSLPVKSHSLVFDLFANKRKSSLISLIRLIRLISLISLIRFISLISLTRFIRFIRLISLFGLISLIIHLFLAGFLKLQLQLQVISSRSSSCRIMVSFSFLGRIIDSLSFLWRIIVFFNFLHWYWYLPCPLDPVSG